MKLDPVMRIAATVGVAALLATWFGVRPLHVRAATIEEEASALHRRAAAETVPAARLDAHRREAARREAMIEREGVFDLPVGPPDLARVIRRLSLPIDGVRVIDQTFTARRTRSAGIGAPEWWRSSPIEVELVADWASIRRFIGFVDGLATPTRITTFELERLDERSTLARLRIEIDALHLAASAGAEEGAPPQEVER